MCGISGYYSSRDCDVQLENSLELISHRGPDSRGTMSWCPVNGKKVTFGHVRLSILDTSHSGDQPMVSSNGLVAMIFNGEIYNHNQLREKLKDHHFTGHSDSEVLLEYYTRFGVTGFKDLRGMFAAAFLHTDSGKMIIVRDQLGIKPVYYVCNQHNFYFSSEIRGLAPFHESEPAVSREALFEFLNCGFVYEPNTGIEGIHKVPAGCFLEFDGTTFTVCRYFSLEEQSRVVHKFDKSRIFAAIKGQLEADVKLGVFFSGGLDSSVIAAVARKDSLFVAYDSNEIVQSGIVNDEPYAQEISKELHLKLDTIRLDSEDDDINSIIDSMKVVAECTEELISDYTYVASQTLAKAARNSGYKVMLSGMGGDELFIGYPRYRLLFGMGGFKVLSWILKAPFLLKLARQAPSLGKKIDRFVSFYNERHFAIAYARTLGYLSDRELRLLWKGGDYDSAIDRFNQRCNKLIEEFANDAPLIKAMVLDYYGFLSHNLMVADKSSMQASLELRVPLLDQDLYCSYFGALRSGNERQCFGKWRLKEALYKFLPKSLIERRKTGFNPPLDNKINLIGRERILKELYASKLCQYINIAGAEGIVDEHFSGEKNNTYKIWQLLYLGYWLNNFDSQRSSNFE